MKMERRFLRRKILIRYHSDFVSTESGIVRLISFHSHDRGIPVEIQLGTKMLSTGLDRGLKGTCLNEKRKITIPAELGKVDILPDGESELSVVVRLVDHRNVKKSTDVNQKMDQKTVYEIHVTSISEKTTVNTFNYLDLDGDRKISAEEAESLVKMFMNALSTDMGIDVKHLVSFFMALHDKDNDNFISETEFLNSVNAHEQVLDALTSRDEL